MDTYGLDTGGTGWTSDDPFALDGGSSGGWGSFLGWDGWSGLGSFALDAWAVYNDDGSVAGYAPPTASRSWVPIVVLALAVVAAVLFVRRWG